jgi:hypothetical protein
MESNKTPMPGYCLAIIDKTQFNSVEFKGDDRFDLPQTGILTKLTKQDEEKPFNENGDTYGSLIGKKISWAKYAEADCLIYDNDLKKDIVIIALDKLRSYE